MELLVIRHGQSEADLIGRHEGRADFPLTPLGLQQAEQMAEWVQAHLRPDVIFSSPLKRAAKTAEILAGKTNLPVLYCDELMEYNNGLLAGLTFEEGSERYPRPDVKLPHESYYEQETQIAFRARAETILSRLIHENAGICRMAIVSHGSMINMLFQSFLVLPMNCEISMSTGDTGIHLWRIEGLRRHIVFMNRTQHLLIE